MRFISGQVAKASMASPQLPGKLREVLVVGVALERRGRFQAVLDAVQGGAQDRGHHQIGVHVAARDTMLDPPGRVGRGRDADRGGAVFVGPADAGRRMGVGDQSVITVFMRREDQRRSGHGAQHPQPRGAARPSPSAPLSKMFRPSASKIEKCMCRPEPDQTPYGLAMKLAAKPNSRATPFVIILNSQASSAAFSGSAGASC